jgi:hypothetical protein
VQKIIAIKERLMRMIILLCGIMYGGSACAILDVEYVGTVNEIKVYRDHNNADMYYYSPGRILLATNTQGAPEFKFLQMRYSGSAATGDQGEFRFKSILQVAVRFQGINAADLDLLRSTVDANGSADFLPLPIHHVNAFLVYSSIGKPNSGGSVSGQLESGDGNLFGKKKHSRSVWIMPLPNFFGKHWEMGKPRLVSAMSIMPCVISVAMKVS